MTGALVWAQQHWAELSQWVGSGLLLAVMVTLLVLAVWHGTRHRRPAQSAQAMVECGPVRPHRHRGYHRRPRRMPVRHPGQRGTVYRSRAGRSSGSR